jgi:hypothetical protein
MFLSSFAKSMKLPCSNLLRGIFSEDDGGETVAKLRLEDLSRLLLKERSLDSSEERPRKAE